MLVCVIILIIVNLIYQDTIIVISISIILSVIITTVISGHIHYSIIHRNMHVLLVLYVWLNYFVGNHSEDLVRTIAQVMLTSTEKKRHSKTNISISRIDLR